MRPRAGLFSRALVGLAVVLMSWIALMAVPSFHPARWRDGSLPSLPPATVVGGGEVMLELSVAGDGAVRDVKVLRTTPPYTEAVITAAKTWRFSPAEFEDDGVAAPPETARSRTVDSTVLVVGIFRPPTLNTPTLGESPRDVGEESNDTPFPITTVVPLFPPRAQAGGLVLIETRIGLDGRASETRVIRSAPPFDEMALDALRQWTFRPARVRGVGTPVFAYVIFGFRQPVTSLPGVP
jgi:TonB family protein